MALSKERELKIAIESVELAKATNEKIGMYAVKIQKDGSEKRGSFDGLLEMLKSYPQMFRSYSFSSKRFLFTNGLYKIEA